MKTKLILLFSALCILTTSAQTYKSFLGTDTVKWSIATDSWGSRTMEWIVLPQTSAVFNGKTYKPLLEYLTFNTSQYYIVDSLDAFWRRHSPTSYSNHNFYIRESEDFSKLFLYLKDIDTEYLIADLNLNVGDNINQTQVVDSIYYYNGLKHLRFYEYNEIYQSKFTFIEGVGTNFGLFYMLPVYILGYNGYCLQCVNNNNFFYKNDKSIYSSKPCFFDFSAGVDNTKYEPFILDKVSDKLEIKFESEALRTFTLYDLFGRKILSFRSSTMNATIPLDNFNKGIYILKIKNYSSYLSQNIKLTL